MGKIKILKQLKIINKTCAKHNNHNKETPLIHISLDIQVYLM